MLKSDLVQTDKNSTTDIIKLIFTLHTIKDLKKITEEFFNLYWDTNKLENEEIPTWSENIWEYDGELPSNNKKGCYAHLNGVEVVYIGLGIGKSYDGSGIGARVRNYWKKNTDHIETGKSYTPTIKDVTGIITLPFPDKYFHLAAALEVFLIQKMPYLKNKVHKK